MKRLLGLLLVMGMVGCGQKENAGNAVAPSIGADEQLVTDSGEKEKGPSNPNAEVATSTPAETDDPVATPLPDAATVKQTLTPAQLAVGDPIENSIGMVLVPIPAGEFQMGSPATESGRQLVERAAPNDSDQTVPSWRARGDTGPMASGDGHDAVEG